MKAKFNFLVSLFLLITAWIDNCYVLYNYLKYFNTLKLIISHLNNDNICLGLYLSFWISEIDNSNIIRNKKNEREF